jgi:hypothetical protein
MSDVGTPESLGIHFTGLLRSVWGARELPRIAPSMKWDIKEIVLEKMIVENNQMKQDKFKWSNPGKELIRSGLYLGPSSQELKLRRVE